MFRENAGINFYPDEQSGGGRDENTVGSPVEMLSSKNPEINKQFSELTDEARDWLEGNVSEETKILDVAFGGVNKYLKEPKRDTLVVLLEELGQTKVKGIVAGTETDTWGIWAADFRKDSSAVDLTLTDVKFNNGAVFGSVGSSSMKHNFCLKTELSNRIKTEKLSPEELEWARGIEASLSDPVVTSRVIGFYHRENDVMSWVQTTQLDDSGQIVRVWDEFLARSRDGKIYTYSQLHKTDLSYDKLAANFGPRINNVYNLGDYSEPRPYVEWPDYDDRGRPSGEIQLNPLALTKTDGVSQELARKRSLVDEQDKLRAEAAHEMKSAPKVELQLLTLEDLKQRETVEEMPADVAKYLELASSTEKKWEEGTNYRLAIEGTSRPTADAGVAYSNALNLEKRVGEDEWQRVWTTRMKQWRGAYNWEVDNRDDAYSRPIILEELADGSVKFGWSTGVNRIKISQFKDQEFKLLEDFNLEQYEATQKRLHLVEAAINDPEAFKQYVPIPSPRENYSTYFLQKDDIAVMTVGHQDRQYDPLIDSFRVYVWIKGRGIAETETFFTGIRHPNSKFYTIQLAQRLLAVEANPDYTDVDLEFFDWRSQYNGPGSSYSYFGKRHLDRKIHLRLKWDEKSPENQDVIQEQEFASN